MKLARDMKLEIEDLTNENRALRAEIALLTEPPVWTPADDTERTLARWLGHAPGIFDDPGGRWAEILRRLVLRASSSCGNIQVNQAKRRLK